ncbi:MAG TPA: hypothetical protein VE462_05250 [Propionibacteriaceae bacterium]|jgi:hypothetical protein|nr:hypothetical protein [Propionibacteriaceae bacterium]
MDAKTKQRRQNRGGYDHSKPEKVRAAGRDSLVLVVCRWGLGWL